jgi:hypothetical protein
VTISNKKPDTRSRRPAAPSALRHDLRAQDIDPDTPAGRWLLALLSRGECAESGLVTRKLK